MEALFACTKCNSRHPFEELSQGQQLCKVNEGRMLTYTLEFINLNENAITTLNQTNSRYLK